jgi:hypothetical protein
MKKTAKLVKKMKFPHVEYTYHGLVKWYHAMFEKLGWMILAKEYGMHDKISTYKHSLERLKDGIIQKHKEMENNDKHKDLEIMLRNVTILIKHAHKDF